MIMMTTMRMNARAIKPIIRVGPRPSSKLVNKKVSGPEPLFAYFLFGRRLYSQFTLSFVDEIFFKLLFLACNTGAAAAGSNCTF